MSCTKKEQVPTRTHAILLLISEDEEQWIVHLMSQQAEIPTSKNRNTFDSSSPLPNRMN
jgi:hypothetical protein